MKGNVISMKNCKRILALTLTTMLLLVGLLPVSTVIAANTDATLKDISFDNHSVFDFYDSNDGHYFNVQQPYRYSKDGNYFKDAEVTATPNDPEATVVIEKNQDSWGNRRFDITVTAADGLTQENYWLLVSQIGKNMYTNSGMETSINENWKVYNGIMEWSTSKAYAGNYSLYSKKNTNNQYYPGTLKLPSLRANRTYIASMASWENNSSYDLVPWDAIAISSVNTVTDKYFNEDGTQMDAPAFLSADENGWRRFFRTVSFYNTASPNDNTKTASLSLSARYNEWVGLDAYYDEFYVGDLVISDVKVSGQSFLEAGTRSVQYTAELFNQFGNKAGLANETVTWRLVNAPQQASINSATGELTLSEDLAPGTVFYVEALVTPSFAGAVQTKAGGRIKVGVPAEDGTASLMNIAVNGGSIPDFVPTTTDYTILVPYTYEANNFNIKMPEVSAIAMEKGAKIKVTYPDKAENGEEIYIDVTDTTGFLNKRYTLTIQSAGMNLIKDGGFEMESEKVTDRFQKADDHWGHLTISKVADNTLAGNYVFNAEASANSGNNTEPYYYYVYPNTLTLAKDKTYIYSYFIKNNNEGSHDIVSELYFKPKLTDITEANYDQNGNLLSDNKLSITENWQQATKVFSLATEGTRFGINIHDAKEDDDKYALESISYRLDDLYISELIISSVVVKDSNNANTKTMFISDDDTQIQLSAAALNQYGNSAGLDSTTAPISWSIVGSHEGVSVDENGVVTVSSDAKAGTVIIEATATPTYAGHVQTSVGGRYTLNLYARNGVKYTRDGVDVFEISAGEIKCTLNYTNTVNSEEAEELMFLNALYEVTGEEENEVLRLVEVKGSVYAAPYYNTIHPFNYLNIPDDGKNYIVKSFIWQNEVMVPVLSDNELN